MKMEGIRFSSIAFSFSFRLAALTERIAGLHTDEIPLATVHRFEIVEIVRTAQRRVYHIRYGHICRSQRQRHEVPAGNEVFVELLRKYGGLPGKGSDQ